MDPVTLIVAALVAGASAGVTDSAKDAVAGLYGRLTSALVARFGQDETAGRTLQRHAANPGGYEVAVRDLIVESGAEQDPRVLDLARELLATADPEGIRVGRYNVTVTGGTVGAIGDNATVTQTIGKLPDQ